MENREPGLFVKFYTKYLILSPYMAILSIDHRLVKIKKGTHLLNVVYKKSYNSMLIFIVFIKRW